jgi:hypothetical protein
MISAEPTLTLLGTMTPRASRGFFLAVVEIRGSYFRINEELSSLSDAWNFGAFVRTQGRFAVYDEYGRNRVRA